MKDMLLWAMGSAWMAVSFLAAGMAAHSGIGVWWFLVSAMTFLLGGAFALVAAARLIWEWTREPKP